LGRIGLQLRFPYLKPPMPGRLSILALLLLCVMGCARNTDGTWKAPFVYRIDIQQGNVVDQEMINKLQPGMDKKQVKYILGTPLMIDPFHTDRWDYLYSFEPGTGERQQRRVTLFFDGEHLARIEGDIKITDRPAGEEELQNERSVAVPLEENKPGFFKRMFSRDKQAAPEEVDSGSAQEETEATAAMDETTAPSETDVTDTGTSTPGAETETAPSPQAEETVEDITPTPATTPEAQAAASATVDPKEKSTAGDPGEKNLLRRFWDRMTKSDMETDTDEETEQDRRDAEVLEDAGGEL